MTLLRLYADISSLPLDKRPTTFSGLSSYEKADLFKFHLAFQLAKHSDLTKEQNDLILDAIEMTAPGNYDNGNFEARVRAQENAKIIEQRAKLLFPGVDAFRIFANLGGNEDEVQLLRKYQLLTSDRYDVERRADFKALTPQDKSNIVKTHLALEMVSRSMNKVQGKFVSTAMYLFSSEAYGYAKGTPEYQHLDRELNLLREQMPKFFDKQDAVLIFTSLGGLRGSPEVKARIPTLFENEYPAFIFTSFNGRNGSYAFVHYEVPDCSCALQSDYCGWWRSGSSCGTAHCSGEFGGCGTGLLYDCNGLCSGGIE